ncbi:hypothetical protein [Nitrobacter hamburgensis]|uniref:hypothetical protein n=1 Tax=Nitrobacter hamburgensis TaxID=912 RepID=UPI00059E554D|nr:hypothetical protein [Nitrobacter hamburgensis]
MSNVVQFIPRRSDRVVIDCARVAESTVLSCRGEKRIVHAPPVLRYFVTLYEACGGEIGLWDGASYGEAREAAREASADWRNCTIIDHVREVPV